MPRREANSCCSSPKTCPLTREVMREERREEEEQGREMEGELPAWEVRITKYNEENVNMEINPKMPEIRDT